MSMYDNYEKDELFDLIKEFLKHHPVHVIVENCERCCRGS